jgi:hypothetical protein
MGPRHGRQAFSVYRSHEAVRRASNDYVKTVLKVPRECIVVIGASTAVKVVLQAALLRPNTMGMPTVIGTMSPPDLPDNSRRRDGAALRILGFHGEKDRLVSPAHGRRVLEETFGRKALLPPRGMWHVFPNEDHTLYRDESLAVVHAPILRKPGLIECNADQFPRKVLPPVQ